MPCWFEPMDEHWDAMTPWTVKVLSERDDVSGGAKPKIPSENVRRCYGLG